MARVRPPIYIMFRGVAIIVNGSDFAEHSPQLGGRGADNVEIKIGQTIAGRIP